MTTYCKIGPIQLPNQYITDNDNPGVGDGSEVFSVVCTPAQAYQIRGLVTPFIKEQFYNRNVLNIPDGYWGLLPIDASTGLDDNDFINHRGLGYLITQATLNPINPFLVQVDLETEEILPILADYLKMDYTTGLGDGTNLSSNYADTLKVDRLNDQFTGLDTTNVWYPAVSSGLTGASFTSNGTELVGVGAASTGVLGSMFIASRTTVSQPFTIETTLEWSGFGNANPYYNSINLMQYHPVTVSDYNTLNIFRVIVKVTTSATYYVQTRIKNAWVTFATGSLTSGQLTPNFKIVVDSNKKATVFIDKAGTTNWVSVASNIDVSKIWNSAYGFNVVYGFSNQSATSHTTYSQQIEIYNYDALVPVNVVSLPPVTAMTSPTFTRSTSDGTINCYANPTGTLLYQPTIDTFYNGTVKGYTNDYSDSVYRLITNNETTIQPLNFYVSNGIIQLTTTANGVQVSYWNGTTWVVLDTFIIGTITRLKVTKVSPTKFTFKANQTEWTLEIGKPYCRVKHQYTDLTHTLRTCVNNDGVTQSDLASGASVNMLLQRYATMWNHGTGTCAAPNPADNNQLLIIKQNTATIKTNVIPADTMTGIGIVDNTQIAGSFKDAIGITKEFFYQTLQAIMTE
jgi:hypothetical protein